AEHLDDGRKETRRDRQVKEAVPLGVVRFVSFRDLLLQALVSFRIAEVAPNVVDAFDHPVQSLLGNRCGSKGGNILAQLLAESLGSKVIHRKADDGELLWQKLFLSEIAEGRQQLALGEIPAGAEDDHHAGRSGGNVDVIHGS